MKLFDINRENWQASDGCCDHSGPFKDMAFELYDSTYTGLTVVFLLCYGQKHVVHNSD